MLNLDLEMFIFDRTFCSMLDDVVLKLSCYVTFTHLFLGLKKRTYSKSKYKYSIFLNDKNYNLNLKTHASKKSHVATGSKIYFLYSKKSKRFDSYLLWPSECKWTDDQLFRKKEITYFRSQSYQTFFFVKQIFFSVFNC